MSKMPIVVAPDDLGVLPDDGVVLDRAKKAGWTDDPMDGKAVLVDDVRGAPAYEVLNPMSIAPPIGWEPTPPIEELINTRIREALFQLKDDDEVDDIIDAEDFDVSDELPPLETIYEVLAMEAERPPIDVKEPSLEEKAKADAEYEILLERHRKMAKKRSRAEYEKKMEEARLYGDDPPPREAEKPED